MLGLHPQGAMLVHACMSSHSFSYLYCSLAQFFHDECDTSQQKAQSAFETQKEQSKMTDAEREELEVTKRRAEGTPCNKENFEAWQARFLQEMAEEKSRDDDNEDGKGGKKKDKGTKDVDKSGRLTGFEHFSNKMDNFQALEAAAEEAENGDFDDVDEELFDDDVDLDDLEFDDEDDEDDEEVDI
jgi:hypothetical protein